MNNKIDELLKWSNPKKAQAMAKKWLGKDAELFVSLKDDKKYDVYDPINKKMGFIRSNWL